MQNGILIVIASLLAELVLLVLAGVVVLFVKRRGPEKKANDDEGLAQEYMTLAQRLTEVHEVLMKSHDELSMTGHPAADLELRRSIGILRRSAALLGSGQASATQVGMYLLDAHETLLMALLEQSRAVRPADPVFDLPHVEPVSVAPVSLSKLGLKAELEALHQLVSDGLEGEAKLTLLPVKPAIAEPIETYAYAEQEDQPLPPSQVEDKKPLPMMEVGDYLVQSDRPLTEAEIEALMQADLEKMIDAGDPVALTTEPEPPESAPDEMGSLLQDEIDALLGMAQEEAPPVKAAAAPSAPKPEPARAAAESAPDEMGSLLQDEIDALLGMAQEEAPPVKAAAAPSAPKPEPARAAAESAPDEMGSLLQDEIDALLGMAQEEAPPVKAAAAPSAPKPEPARGPAPVAQAIEIMDAWQPVAEPEPTYLAIGEKGPLLQDEIDALLNMAQEATPVKKNGLAKAPARENLPTQEAAPPAEGVHLSEMVMQDEIDALMRARDEQVKIPKPVHPEPLLQDEIDSLMNAPRLPVSTPPEPLPADRGALLQDEIDAVLNAMAAEAVGHKNGNDAKKTKRATVVAIPQAHHVEMDLQSEIDALFSASR